MSDKHNPPAPQFKEPAPKHPPGPHPESTGGKPHDEHKGGSQASPKSDPTRDQPHADTARDPGSDPKAAPLVRPTETLPVEPTGPQGAGDPVGHARHAESDEERQKIEAMEYGKPAPAGSRHYVAGQPVNEEEYRRTEDEANRLAQAGKAQRTEAEKRMAENTPGDPDYHPADPDKRDTPKALGEEKESRR